MLYDLTWPYYREDNLKWVILLSGSPYRTLEGQLTCSLNEAVRSDFQLINITPQKLVSAVLRLL